jgi:hypothetical protein
VARIVPTFAHEEACVYFFCIKILEEYIQGNRVAGTFGGWTLGNEIRLKEELEESDIPYPLTSYNPYKWSEHWKEFQRQAYIRTQNEKQHVIIKFDIANFYDSINLGLLENKLRHIVPKEKAYIIDLLFQFLKNWNRHFEKYTEKKVGLPQDEIGDCSRILANFYLQDYDLIIKSLCESKECTYLRYADDQIIFSPSIDVAKYMIFEASKQLFKINLNINSSKVDVFTDKNNFLKYWAFDIHNLLDDDSDSSLNRAIKISLERKVIDSRFRWDSVLKRISMIQQDRIDFHLRFKIYSELLEPDFLVTLNSWWFSKIRDFLQNDQELFRILDRCVDGVYCNSFLYYLLSFYKKYRKDYDVCVLIKKIDDLKVTATRV